MNFNKITLATLMALLFAACSEENDSLGALGGAEEETGVYAKLENITILGKACMTNASAQNSSNLGRIVVTGLEKGSVVSLYQLDPKTFAMSDSSITEVVGDDGVFAFQNVTLESPYVLIYAVRPAPENGYPYSTLVDVRDTDEINIDILTHLEALRALYLVQSGKTFAQAKKLAREQVLASFGMYGIADDIRVADTLEYTAIISALADILPTNVISLSPISVSSKSSSINKLFSALAERGAFLNVDPVLDERFIDVVLGLTGGLRGYFSVPAVAYQKLSDGWAQDYQIRLRTLKFYSEMLAAALDAGRCDSKHEGKIVEVPVAPEKRDYMAAYNLVCRSENWNLVNKEAEHLVGSMVDDRDGQVYKTATINIDGESQTWMAENLRYDGGEGTSCDDDGCHYNSFVTVGLDSSYFIFDYAYESYEACVDFWRDNVPEPYGGTVAFCTDAMANPWVELDTTKVDLSDTVKYQGVCPAGWRLPNPRDWKKLLSFVKAEFGTDNNSSTLYLYDLAPFGNPTGVGLTARYSIMWLGHTPDFVPDPSSGLLSVYGTDLATAPGYADVYYNNGYAVREDLVNVVRIGSWGMAFSYEESQKLVRCIKE